VRGRGLERGRAPSPGKNIFLYNGPVVRVSASHSSDLPHVEVVGVRRRGLHGEGAVLPPQEKIFLYNTQLYLPLEKAAQLYAKK